MKKYLDGRSGEDHERRQSVRHRRVRRANARAAEEDEPRHERGSHRTEPEYRRPVARGARDLRTQREHRRASYREAEERQHFGGDAARLRELRADDERGREPRHGESREEQADCEATYGGCVHLVMYIFAMSVL